ncbi:porin [Enterovirga aerilata]|uniref:Porin n=1 Tax=Enterovirga aerilata TaxID=2730920 RepID=A0A849I8U8_9HYPH|nr:porin [Enterovirga sp. DB1703]NNM74224.1 porin [Enterovirga sp. DB1703]
MKLVKSLLLGSAAGFCAVAGAQAADLPVRKAAPVEYVRVCTAHGAGFFFIPGTDTCLRVGGRARFEYQYTQQNTRNASVSGFRGLGRLNIDARTSTPYGTLRAFVRFEIASRTGGYLKSGTQERFANAFPGFGQDTVSQLQKYVDVDKAFVQFAGITAGRAQSFYDFYAGDLEFFGAGIYSNANTNLLAYTATFGGGFSATISMEDPVYRRNPVFTQANTGVIGLAAGLAPSAQNGVNFVSGAVPLAFVGNVFNAAGVPTSGLALDVAQRSNLPDFVGALRYDGAWGSAQVAAAVHEVRVGGYAGLPTILSGAGAFVGPFPTAVGGVAVPASVAAQRVPDAAYGFAVQGGLKVNLPQLAPGDQIWIQGAYGQGAGSFTGVFNPPGSETNFTGITNRFVVNQNDAVVDGRGNLNLTETWSVMAALLHYWSPEWRQSVFGTYGQANYDPRLRNANFGPAGITSTFTAGVPTATGATVNPFNSTLSSYDIFYGGSNLIWSPVRDLDIGVEVIYQRIWLPRAVADANRGSTAPASGTTVVGAAGVGPRTTTFDDNIMARIRVQRDF